MFSTHMRSAARYAASFIVGLFSAALTAWLITVIGVDEETASELMLLLTETLTTIVFIVMSFVTSKLLKRIKSLDPAGWADYIWRHDVGRQIKDIPEDEARFLIKENQSRVTNTPPIRRGL